MSSTTKTVSTHYIEGIKEGRASFEKYGIEAAQDELRNLNSTIKGFDSFKPGRADAAR